MAQNGSQVLQVMSEPSLLDEISAAEQDLLLQNFRLLKERAANGRDGEMRIAVRRDSRTGIVEVTYCGIGEKANLESLRTMYGHLRTKGTKV